MKRKFYVKQMNMLKEKAKSKTKDKKDTSGTDNGSTASDSSPIHQYGMSSDTQEVDSKTPVLPQPSALSTSAATSIPAASSSTLASLQPQPSPLPHSTTVSNSLPLPKVDVLMKRSTTLRAFQLRQTQHDFVDTDQQHLRSASHLDDNDTNAIQVYQRDERSNLAYVDDRQHQDDGLQGWQKDYSLVEQNPNRSPKPIPSPYHMEYPSSYESNVNQPSSQLRDRHDLQASSSPVFHQLQARSVADDSMYMETTAEERIEGLSEHSKTVELRTDPNLHNSYDNSMADSRSTPHHHHHNHHHHQNHHHNQQHQQHHGSNMISYDNNHEVPHRHHAQEEHIQMHGGHIRAWEQENYRYVDFTWRHEGEFDSKDMSYPSTGEEDDDDTELATSIDSSSNGLDKSLDLINKTSRPSHKGRRRRKRVQTPVQRSAANTRERRRMLHLNVAFDYLKEHLPNVKDKKKMSRIQTLKAAIYYIHLLQDSLNVH